MEEIKALIRLWLNISHFLIILSLSQVEIMGHIILGVYKLGLFVGLRWSLSCKTEVKVHETYQYNITVIVNYLMNHQCMYAHKNTR